MGVDAIVVRHPAARRAAPRRVVDVGAAWSTRATAATSTPRRRCSTRSRCAGTAARRSTVAGSRSSATSATPVWPAAMSSRSTRSAASSRSSARPRSCPSASTAGPSRVTSDLDDVLPDVDVVYLLRIQTRTDRAGVVPVAARVLRALGSERRTGRPLQARHARDASRPDEPGHRDRGRGRRLGPLARHRTGRQRCGGPHGRALVAARLRRSRLSESQVSAGEVLIQGGRVLDATGDHGRRRARRRRTDRRGRCGVVAVGRCDRARRARAASSRPASSTSRCTSANRAAKTRRRSRPARGPPRSAGAPPWSACRTPIRPSTTPRSCSRSSTAAARSASATCRRRCCITKGRRGEELAPMGELYDLGVRVFTDDGDCVADARVMRHAFEYAAALPGAVLAQHAEDPALVRGGHMHEGAWSARLGIPGRPAEAESTIVARDLQLAKLTGGRYHVLHMSCAAVGRARARRQGRRRARHGGVHAAASRAHRRVVLATSTRSFKMNPPLREQRRRRRVARRRSLDGTIDAIATDHAPHTAGEQGRAVRGGAAGHARRGDRAGGRAHHARRAGRAHARARRSARCRGSPARVVGLDADGHGGPVAAGRAREPLRDRPRAHAGRSTPTRLASKSPQLALGRAGSSPARSGTPSCGGTPTVRDGERNQMKPENPAIRWQQTRLHEAKPLPSDGRGNARMKQILPTWDRGGADDRGVVGAGRRRDVRGRRGRAISPTDGVATGEVVFNTALVGLPGDPHRSVVRRADHHVHVSAHRQLRRERATTTRRGPRTAGA